MGMSASQARLLSITSRLSDNELRSQTITNAKSALSTRTAQASAEYLAALDETEMFFATYDDDGNKVTSKLTGTCLTQYAPLKNQYAIINSDNQIVVAEIDAHNYLESATMGEFLEKYGVATVEDVEVDNPKYIDKATYIYGSDWNSWVTNGDGTKGGLNGLEPMLPDYNKVEWEETTDATLYPKFKAASQTCYNNAMGGGAGCYLHVLAHLLDLEVDDKGNPISSAYPKDYTTTYGQNISIEAFQISGSAIHGAGDTVAMVEVSNAVTNGKNGKTYYAAEDLADKAQYEALADNTEMSDDEKMAAKLLSNYYTDSSGQTQLKTLKQKIIDLFYAVKNRSALNIDYDTTLKNALARFQKDMELAQQTPKIVPDEPAWRAAHDEWQAKMEKELAELNAMDRFVIDDVITVSDKDQAQWYVNLWHRMNGASDYKVEIDGVENGAKPDKHYLGQDEEEDKFATMANNLINGLTDNGKILWSVLEDGLMNSAEWLSYGLKNNIVTLERVNFTEPTEDGSGLEQATWTSIIYSNALDISEQENEKAITKAEVKYQQQLKDIEAKDKQYDNMIRRLDTEHNALQTEYEAIKNVISKNIERTLKMYS